MFIFSIRNSFDFDKWKTKQNENVDDLTLTIFIVKIHIDCITILNILDRLSDFLV